MDVEDARAERAAEDEQVRGGAGGLLDGEESWPNRDAGDLAVAEPRGGSGKVDRGGLDSFADKAVG
jgi:hypothetical protein